MGMLLGAVGWLGAAAPTAAQGGGEEPLYREKYRPQFHFSARQWSYRQLNPGQRDEGWLNDPNGLVYVAGEWHYFAQRWAHAWIHAVSRDLVHWEELKPAFWEDDPFGPVQSGTVVIDSANTSGLRTGANPLMVAFWSSWNNRDQCISYSNDLGRTWTKYAGNPVLVHVERDPQVFWHAPTRNWAMVLYGGTGYHFFTSDNLLEWKKESSIDGFFECPDLFALAVDGDRADTRWILMNGDGSYLIGGFDGRKFSPQTAKRRLDWGEHFYATQSWHNVPESDGRRIQTTWMRSDGKQFYPDMPFNQQTSFPAALTLRDYADTLRLFRNPVKEIANLHLDPRRQAGKSLASGGSLALDADAELWHIQAHLTLADNSEGEFRIHGATVRVGNDHLAVNGGKGPFARRLNRIAVELLVDRTSIEAFGNRGEVSVTQCIRATNQAMSLHCTKGSLTLDSLVQYPLKSIWPDSPRQGFESNLAGPWTPVGGAWKDTATGKRGDGPGDIFALSGQSGGDFTYAGEVELFTAAGASLVFRANDAASEGYCVNVDIAGFIKLWAPGRGEIARFTTPINARQPYHLKVVARGANLKIYFNHRASPVLNYTDPQPRLSGRFGVNLYNGMAQFQSLRAEPYVPAPTRPTAKSSGSAKLAGKAYSLAGRRLEWAQKKPARAPGIRR